MDGTAPNCFSGGIYTCHPFAVLIYNKTIGGPFQMGLCPDCHFCDSFNLANPSALETWTSHAPSSEQYQWARADAPYFGSIQFGIFYTGNF